MDRQIDRYVGVFLCIFICVRVAAYTYDLNNLYAITFFNFVLLFHFLNCDEIVTSNSEIDILIYTSFLCTYIIYIFIYI